VTTRTSGFAMLDVLVAMGLMAVTLVGALGSQVSSFQEFRHLKQMRVINDSVSILVASMTVNFSAITRPTYIVAGTTVRYKDHDCSTNCTAVQLAEKDLFQMTTVLAKVLDDLEYKVAIDSNNMVSISIKWNNNSKFANGQVSCNLGNLASDEQCIDFVVNL